MFYILLRKTNSGLASTYAYLTTVAAETGEVIKKSFETIGDAQAYVQTMIAGGDYALGDFIVVKGVTVTATLTLAEETA